MNICDFSKLTEIAYLFCLLLDEVATWGSNLTDLWTELDFGQNMKVIGIWVKLLPAKFEINLIILAYDLARAFLTAQKL